MQEEQKEESVFLYNAKKRNVFNAETMRLIDPKDFKKCFQSGKKIKNSVFSLYYLNNGGLDGRLGVNIAKSKVKEAVKECDVVITYKQQEVEEFEKWAEKESKKEVK